MANVNDKPGTMPTGKGTTPPQMPAAAGVGSEAVVKAAGQLAAVNLSDTDADADKCCASCGKTGDGPKRCTACRSVWYCGVQCQIDHRKAHKKECKRIKKEIELWKPHPPTKECPVCLVPLPLQLNRATYWPCCGQMVCCACKAETERALNITNRKRKNKELPPMKDSCAFCRVPAFTTDSELIKEYEERVDKGDVDAMVMLARYYKEGELGLVRDEAKALELTRRAADLGSPDALGRLGSCFLYGELGVIRDEEKARVHWEDAAKKGDAISRCILGVFEEENEEHDLAIKHYKLAAAAGDESAVKHLWKYFPSKLDKAELEEILRAHKEACDEMNSEERKRFIAYQEALDGNDDTLKSIYVHYYEGVMTAKELNKALKVFQSGDVDQALSILSKCRRACGVVHVH